MSVEYNYCTGRPSDVITRLKRKVTRTINNNSYVKVGITNNPETRWNQHRANDPTWTKMLVVYQSSSINHVRELESDLITHRWEELHNQRDGGGGNIGEGRQYLYFLIQE
jgi:hypothetical protein